jgi:dTDP-L-rhamnose 4-epimerase
VTGGAGFIGSHTVDLLLAKGYEVRVLDTLDARVHPDGKPNYLGPDVQFIKGDVSDAADLAKALDGVRLVFHLAAYQDYMPDFSRFIHTNAESAALLFELAVRDRARFPVERIVFASSQAVSGEGKYRCTIENTIFYPGPRSIKQLEQADWNIRCPSCNEPADPQLIDELTCNNPHTAYGISKYCTELLAFRLGSRYGITTAAMRYTYVQGPRNSIFNAYSGIARRFALRIRAGLAPVCFEDGAQLRDYVNVYDVASSNVLVLETPAADGVAFNVGGGRAVTVLEFARIMLNAFDKPDLVPEIPGVFRVGDTRHTVSDIGRLRALGWEPTTTVEDNVKQYIAWLETQSGTEAYMVEAERAMVTQGILRQTRPQR